MVMTVIQCIHMHTEKFGIPHPAPLRGRATSPPVFLPAYQNFLSVHVMYMESCTEGNVNAVGYDSFRSIWHACVPNIKFMTPRTEVCESCKILRRNVVSAACDVDKLATCHKFTERDPQAAAFGNFPRATLRCARTGSTGRRCS